MGYSGGAMRQLPVIVMPEDTARPRPGSFLEVSFDSSGTMLYAWGHRDIYGVLFVYEFTEGGGPSSLIFDGKYVVRRPTSTSSLTGS